MASAAQPKPNAKAAFSSTTTKIYPATAIKVTS
jgi:hypothetical protein